MARAGPAWRDHVRTEVVTGVTGVTVGAADPTVMAARWSEVLDAPLAGRDNRAARRRHDPLRADTDAVRAWTCSTSSVPTVTPVRPSTSAARGSRSSDSARSPRTIGRRARQRPAVAGRRRTAAARPAGVVRHRAGAARLCRALADTCPRPWPSMRASSSAPASSDGTSPVAAEIELLAVSRDRHRQGIGRRLVDHVAEPTRRRRPPAASQDLRAVRRLSRVRTDAGLLRSRRFIPLEELPELLWGPENPCLILVMPLVVAS